MAAISVYVEYVQPSIPSVGRTFIRYQASGSNPSGETINEQGELDVSHSKTGTAINNEIMNHAITTLEALGAVVGPLDQRTLFGGVIGLL
ncbi:MAG: hypothetical protein ACRD98_00355 [Nitrososphaera sp.]